MSRSLYSVFATCVSDLSKVHLHDPFRLKVAVAGKQNFGVEIKFSFFNDLQFQKRQTCQELPGRHAVAVISRPLQKDTVTIVWLKHICHEAAVEQYANNPRVFAPR